MPSLRRTLSSPAVRSSPYPSSSSSSSSSAAAQRSLANGQRRSSGSETYTRRVLAEIDWWRVTDGQHDVDADEPPSPDADNDVQAGGLGFTSGGVGVDHLSSSFSFEVCNLFYHTFLPRVLKLFCGSRSQQRQMSMLLWLLLLPEPLHAGASRRLLHWSRLQKRVKAPSKACAYLWNISTSTMTARYLSLRLLMTAWSHYWRPTASTTVHSTFSQQAYLITPISTSLPTPRATLPKSSPTEDGDCQNPPLFKTHSPAKNVAPTRYRKTQIFLSLSLSSCHNSKIIQA